MIVFLPWPPKALSPNAREDRRKVAGVRAKYRIDCACSAKANGATAIEAKALHVTLTFLPPDRKRRDLDNMLAAAKSALDGLADVLKVDDSRWSLTLHRGEPVRNGRITAMIEVTG